MKPRTLIYDIETAPAIGLYFGRPYDVNIAKTIQGEYVFGFAYKWLGEDKIYKCYMWDLPGYGKDPKSFTGWSNNSREVVKRWAELVASADVVVGHNSDRFDYRHMQGRLPQYRLPPIPWPQMVDTKKLAVQIGNYQSNKLDDLGDLMGTGRKLPHNDYPNAIDLWWDCMNNKAKAKKHMVEYNIIDTKRTEALYLLFRPYAKSHPNMATIAGRPNACPKCLSETGFWAQGFRTTKTGKYRRWQCKACGSYVSNRRGEKGVAPNYA
jgi:DNA polymerase elongation subunit (family B)